MPISKILTDKGITVLVTGKAPFVMSSSHKLFTSLVAAVNNKNETEILNIIESAKTAEKYMNGAISFRDGELFYGAERLTGALVDRIFSHQAQGLDNSYLIKFLENLMLNPSFQSRKELYGFLENAGDLPITDDGRFIAYKWVRDDYKDVHSGTFDNSVGKVISMPRGAVDDNRNVTCSSGLHVCSSHYQKFGSKLMLVAVNPKDVVSVPTDYNDSKMRVCEYEVMQEIDADTYGKYNETVFNTGNEEEDEDEYDDEDDNGFWDDEDEAEAQENEDAKPIDLDFSEAEQKVLASLLTILGLAGLHR